MAYVSPARCLRIFRTTTSTITARCRITPKRRRGSLPCRDSKPPYSTSTTTLVASSRADSPGACGASATPSGRRSRVSRRSSSAYSPRWRSFRAGGERPLVIIDYAHTPDALEKVLAALKAVAVERGGRLAVVFGAGGDRDPAKRPVMGAVAERAADRPIITSDNPRSEDPLRIIDAIASGMRAAVPREPDRRRAIEKAVLEAAPEDVVLIAGKGHESYQEIAGKRLPFSDQAVARAALALRGAR